MLYLDYYFTPKHFRGGGGGGGGSMPKNTILQTSLMPVYYLK